MLNPEIIIMFQLSDWLCRSVYSCTHIKYHQRASMTPENSKHGPSSLNCSHSNRSRCPLQVLILRPLPLHNGPPAAYNCRYLPAVLVRGPLSGSQSMLVRERCPRQNCDDVANRARSTASKQCKFTTN